MRHDRPLVPWGLVLTLGACASLQTGPDPDPTDIAYGRALYLNKCAVCHGENAQGNGPHAAQMPTSPPDLTRLAARNGGVFDPDHVMSTIFAGPKAETGSMPAFAHHTLGELIVVERDGLGTPVFTDLLAISNYLETLQR